MFRDKKFLFSFVKWIIMLVAYSYLIYKLAHVEYWSELKHSFESIDLRRFSLLLSVIVLMPFNWALEAKKWQILIHNIVSLSFFDAYKAILAGLNTGFITPSRVGDFAGRILYLPSSLRLSGAIMSFVNGFIQTLAVTVFGVVSIYYYSSEMKWNFDLTKYLFLIGFLIIIFIGIYIFFPNIVKKMKGRKWAEKFVNAFKSLSGLSKKILISAFLISSLRYILFCFQYYLILLFFDIHLSYYQAFIGIPAMYLLITYAPTLAASEAAVRASVAVMVLSVFSSNEIGILLTGILIWIINYIIPMIGGSFFVMKTKKDL